MECPTRGDGQDWDGSHLLELLLNATSLSPLATAKALGLDIPPTMLALADEVSRHPLNEPISKTKTRLAVRPESFRPNVRPPGASYSKITNLLVAVRQSSLRLRVCKRIAYARSRNTASASTSKNWSAGMMATRFISQSGIFRITISKSASPKEP